MNDCYCGTLEDSTTNEIEALLKRDGSNNQLVYIIAIDSEGNLTPLKRNGVEDEPLTLPIKNTDILSINSVSFGSFTGSCCFWYKRDGEMRCFQYPC